MALSQKIRWLVVMLTASILAACLVAISGTGAQAWEPHRRGGEVRELPRGYRTVWAGRDKFFFHGGHFYRHGPRGFIMYEAPIGVIVPALPIGFATIVIGGIEYYSYDDVYYQRAPDGYVVVPQPPLFPPDQVATAPPPMPAPQPAPRGEPLQPQLSAGTAIVQSANLNVRSGPGTDFSVIDQVKFGDRLIIKGSAPGWYYVQLPNRGFGWIMSRHILLEQPSPKG